MGAGQAQCALMSTPKPGQIRCPTCLRSTPPAAYCTQCGSPIPPSARVRPRGMDRDELEERVRRRPGEGGFRRGQQIDDAPASAGYVPYQPEPEDALAVRPDGTEPGVYGQPPASAVDETDEIEPAPAWAGAAAAEPPPAPAPPVDDEPDRDAVDDYDDRAYGEPEDAYAYPYAAAEQGGGGRGGNSLPIIGFVVLCVLALAVGAVLAGLLGGEEQVGQATPTPAASSAPATEQPTEAPSSAPSESSAAATPEPTDGPVTFADGAVYEVQPCGSYEFTPNLSGCQVDGSQRDNGNVWILVIFDNARGNDDVTLQLRSQGETLDSQDKTLGDVVNCGNSCRGLIWGAVYRDLQPGQYELLLRRNGDFADRASFTVGG
jgi:hypothetical protein